MKSFVETGDETREIRVEFSSEEREMISDFVEKNAKVRKYIPSSNIKREFGNLALKLNNVQFHSLLKELNDKFNRHFVLNQPVSLSQAIQLVIPYRMGIIDVYDDVEFKEINPFYIISHGYYDYIVNGCYSVSKEDYKSYFR